MEILKSVGIKSPNNCNGFDIVLGNPPYGANIDKLTKIFEKLYPETSKGFKDIYKYFFAKSYSLLCNNGILCFITPSTFLRQPRYGDLRKLILKYDIIQLLDLGEEVFDAVVPVAISLTKKNKGEYLLYADLSKSENIIKALINIPFKKIEQKLYEKTLNNIFIEEIRIKNENEVILDDVLLMKDCGFKYQRSNVGMAQKGKNDLADRLFYFGEKKDNRDIPILVGQDINSYWYSTEPNKKLRYNYESLLKENEGTYYNKYIMNQPKKLIWRQTAPYFIGTILEQEIFFGNTIQAGIINEAFKDKISYEYLCALLNSKYLRSIYENNVKETGRVFPQVKLEKLKPLPIIIPNTEQHQNIINLVKKIISEKIKNPLADTTKIEIEVNKIVYQIYKLSPEEIKKIESNISV